MVGRYDKPGAQGEWPYPGSGPSGSSDTEAGLARLEALRYVDVSEQGEGGTPQGDRASAAGALRASLREVADPRKPTAPAAPPTPEDIRAALHGGMNAHEAPAPQAVEEIRADQYREALWSAEGTLRNTPEVLVAAADELESIIADGIVPASVVPRLGSIVERLRGINLQDLDVARQQVGTTARAMDVKKNNRQ